MIEVEVAREIDASAGAVWALLTDAEVLQNSELGIMRIEGRIAPGAKFRLWSEVSPERAFRLQVTVFELRRRMVWHGGMPLGLFAGVRVFVIEDLPGRAEPRVRLHIKETFSGLLSGMICRSMPDLQPSFAQFADGIKRLAEERQ